MFIYDKKLQYPVKIANTNPKLASIIISQYGGPDGELGASLRYLSQRYSMPYPELKGLLTDIGTEGISRHQKTRPTAVDRVLHLVKLKNKFISALLFCVDSFCIFVEKILAVIRCCKKHTGSAGRTQRPRHRSHSGRNAGSFQCTMGN